MKKILYFFLCLSLIKFAEAQTLPSYVPNSGLVGWWPFNGNSNDESGNGNNAQLNNSLWPLPLGIDRNGISNHSYTYSSPHVLNGIYLAMNNSQQIANFGISSFTVSVWFRTTANFGVSTNLPILYYGSYNSNATVWYLGDGPMGLLRAVSSGVYNYGTQSSIAISDGNWHQAIYSRDIANTTYNLYLDGQLASSNNYGAFTENIIGSGTSKLYVGSDPYGNTFYGDIDDIGIWNRALTSAEITALYQSGQPCTVTHTTSLNLCRRDSTLWNGQYYSRTGADTVHLTSHRGCDSIDILNLNVYPLYYTVITQYFCKGKSFVFNGQTISTAGTYYFHYTSATGCDSTVRLRALYRAAIPITYVTLPVCVGSNLVYGGQTFTAAGIYKVTLQGYSACDSVIQLTLVKRSKTYSKVTIYRCPNDSVQYYGKYYKANGVHTVILLNRYGCDSVVTLNVLTRPSSYFVQTNYICQGDSLLYQGVYYKQSGTYFIHLRNRYGCDSTVRLRLLYNNSSSLTTVTLCQAQTYMWNGMTYTWNMPGTYVRHFTNYKGCDSTATLKIYKGNCKLSGEAIGTTVTTTENVNDETATPTALEVTHNFEMSIYPNPNTGRFILENNCTTCKQMQVEIRSLDGKLLYAQNEDNSTGKINIDLPLDAGMYWVKMSNVKEGFSEVRKFVIEN